MQIDITQIPVAYINLERDYMKNMQMQSMLTDFSNVIRINATYIQDDPVTALAMSQSEAIGSITVPGLILEDDCVPANYRTQIEVPDDADIVFLGIWDIEKPAIPSGYPLPAYEIYNEDLVKVYSMQGSHAILFVSELGKQIGQRAYEIATTTKLWNDSILKLALPFINAYALRQPIFAQTSNLELTNISYDAEFVMPELSEEELISTPADLENL